MHVMKRNISYGRICGYGRERIDPILFGCPLLAMKEYIHRHDGVRIYVRWKLWQYYGTVIENRWYRRMPENEKEAIVWDLAIRVENLKQIGQI